jgi:hypothetical protein
MGPLLLLLLTAVTCAAAAPKEDQGLQIISRSPQKLHATYHTSAEEGIEVLCNIGTSQAYLLITTFDGVQLFSARSSITGSDTLWSVLGYTILLHSDGNPSETKEYTVPNVITGHVEKVMKRNHVTSKLLRTLNAESTNETKVSAFTELFARPESVTIIDLAHSLGAAGIRGNENPAALYFYGIARNLAMLQGHLETANANMGQDGETGYLAPRRVGKRSWTGGRSSSGCSRNPIGSECLGLCGRGCSCWASVCGDCCYHQKCYEHDICCGRNGYFHYTCLTFSFSRYDCDIGHLYRC